MEFLSTQCCVCLELTLNAEKLTNWDGKNCQWITKLQNVVPEVVWMEHYMICKSCTYNLNIAYEFRALCSRLQGVRTKILLPQFEDSSVIHKCRQCNASFLDKDHLTYHVASCPQRIQPIEEIKLEENRFAEQPPEETKIDIELMQFPEEVKIEAMQPSEEIKTEPTDETNTENATKSDKFTCQICNLELETAKKVVEHCITEHSMDQKAVKAYTCDECSSRFTSSGNLKEHKKYHTGIRSHVCNFCFKCFVTKKDLTVHEHTHLNQRNYKCDICEKSFNTNSCLCSHKRMVHTDSSQWKYHCETCDRRFPSKSNYEQHMRRHSGDKPFVCHICNKPFVSQKELQRHVGYHSYVKPFKCPHCDKGYRERRVYEVHLSKMHGVGNATAPESHKKYVCDVCQLGFRYKDKLDKHMKKHSAVKPDCQFCNMKFTNQTYLKQHLKGVHNVKEEEEGVKLEVLN